MLRLNLFGKEYRHPGTKRFFTTDTGMNTGIANWEYNAVMDSVALTTSQFTARGKTLEDKLKNAWGKFEEVVQTFSPDIVYLESQQFWSQSVESVASAGSADLFKLSYLTGGYANICDSNGVGFKLISPNRWKGQMGKEATKRRVERVFRSLGVNEIPKLNGHVIDAIGIGFSLLELL